MRRYALSLGLALALAGCAPAALLPTPTPAPSATPAPTATPTPSPTPTPAPSPSPVGDASAVIRAALRRSAEADTYRLEVRLAGSGTLGGVELGSDAETELIALSGEFAGEDYRYTLTGFLAGFLGADQQNGLEAVAADGVRYVRGPLSFIGAPDPVWYRLTAAQAALANPPVDAASSLALLRDSGADFSGFAPDGEDRLDDQRCAVYRGDRGATVALLGSLAESGLPATDAAQIAEAESRLTICPDGYLHRIETSFSGEQAGAAGGPARPYSYRLSVELGDFDAAIAIDAPADAVDLPDTPLEPAPGTTP